MSSYELIVPCSTINLNTWRISIFTNNHKSFSNAWTAGVYLHWMFNFWANLGQTKQLIRRLFGLSSKYFTELLVSHINDIFCKKWSNFKEQNKGWIRKHIFGRFLSFFTLINLEFDLLPFNGFFVILKRICYLQIKL